MPLRNAMSATLLGSRILERHAVSQETQSTSPTGSFPDVFHRLGAGSLTQPVFDRKSSTVPGHHWRDSQDHLLCV